MKKLPKHVQPLIDGDWIIYTACSAIEYKIMKEWKDKGSVEPEPEIPFENTTSALEYMVKDILKILDTDQEPILFFSSDKNFRKTISVTKEYKGNRSGEKPFHYNNLRLYTQTRYEEVEVEGMEADDTMAMYQTAALKSTDPHFPTCIVTVDKDLRQVNGWHYSPEGWNYPSFGPTYVDDESSYIKYKDTKKPAKGLIGTGYKFFYAQVIIGDTVDNIPGLFRAGPKKALTVLEHCQTPRECYEAVKKAYELSGQDNLREMIDLLWMVREADEDDEPIFWEEPEADGEMD